MLQRLLVWLLLVPPDIISLVHMREEHIAPLPSLHDRDIRGVTRTDKDANH